MDQIHRAEETVVQEAWAIRHCKLYKDEYDDCTSLKARFHQHFIFGRTLDCSQWLIDFNNCEQYQQTKTNDVEAGYAVIKSEEQRRVVRLKAHYANDTWQKRKHPPNDWAKPLPTWLQKRNENSYLEMKQKEMAGITVPQKNDPGICVVQ